MQETNRWCAVVLCCTTHSGFRFTVVIAFTCMYAHYVRRSTQREFAPFKRGARCTPPPTTCHGGSGPSVLLIPGFLCSWIVQTLGVWFYWNLDNDVAGTMTLSLAGCLGFFLCVRDGFLDGAACERVRCAMGCACSCGVVRVRSCGSSVHGRCISGGVCGTRAATAAFSVTIGTPFHTLVRSSDGCTCAGLTCSWLARGSSRHILVGTGASHGLSRMISYHGLTHVAVMCSFRTWLSHHTLGYCLISISHTTCAKLDSKCVADVAMGSAFLLLAIASALTNCGAMGSDFDGYLQIWGFLVRCPLRTLFFNPHSTLLCSHETFVSRKVRVVLIVRNPLVPRRGLSQML